MDDSSIIPLYLYSNTQNSLISDKKYNFSNTDFVALFYGINPIIKPKPSYTDLICATNSGTTTIDISVLYDGLNFNTNCVRFLAWTERTPNTTPLYIRQNGSNIHISFDKNPINESYIPYKIPVIYVLTSKRKNPHFTFSDSFGKCIPDPESSLSIGQCLVLHNKNIISLDNGKQSTLLNYLENKYGGKGKGRRDIIIIFILFVIFCLLLWKL